jgi:hypothetical protein
VVVAVIAVGKVKMTVDKVAGVIAVRNGLVAATGAVNMALLVPVAIVPLSAFRRVGGAYLETVLVYFAALLMVQASVVQIIDVPVVANGGMAAVGPVGMIVIVMNV